MKIKVIQKAWYDERLYDPEVDKAEDLIIEFAGDKVPSWAEALEGAKEAKKAEGKKPEGGEQVKIKVKDLPLVEKNKIIEEAKAVGIEGNNVLSWNVDTLKGKIEAKKAEGKE